MTDSEKFDIILDKLNSIDSRVLTLESTLENVTNKNISIIAEGHLDLSRKLDEALKVENEKRHLLLYIIPISNLNRFYEETRTAHFHRLHGGGNRRIGAGSLAAETGLAESGAQ